MTDRAPGVRLVEVPVANRIDREQTADATEKCGQHIGLRTRPLPRAECVLPPLHRQRQVFRRVLPWIDRFEQPQRAGVAGMRGKRGLRLAAATPGTARSDEQVGDVFEAALRLVAVEQAVDLAQHDAARGTVAPHMAADQRQRQIVDREVCHRLHRADVTDLRGPRSEVIDFDESDVEIDERVAAGPARIKLGKRQAGELLAGADADARLLAAEHRVDDLAHVAGNVPVGQRVDLVPITDQAGDRRHMDLALHIGDHRVAAADVVERVADRRDLDIGACLPGSGDDADRHFAAVRQIERARHHLVRIVLAILAAERIGIFPALDEDEHRRPGIRTHLGIDQRPLSRHGLAGAAV